MKFTSSFSKGKEQKKVYSGDPKTGCVGFRMVKSKSVVKWSSFRTVFEWFKPTFKMPGFRSPTVLCHLFSGLITHWRIAPGHRRADGVKLIGCDICDAFNIVNGFRDEESVESHTKHVHGEVREHSLMMS